MEENNKKSYNDINSPILNYYSHFINPSSPEYKSEITKIKQTHFPHKSLSPNPIYKSENNKITSTKEIQKDENKEPKSNVISKKNINLNQEEKLQFNPVISNKVEQNDFNKEEYPNKIIRTITPDDLIPTKINGRTILRINPLIYKNESYEFLACNIYLLLKDQLGCKYLQKKLEIEPQIAVFFFYPALIQNILYLIKDAFANYFIQKICYYLNEEQIENILTILSPEFLDICCDSHGNRAIQGIMNNLFTPKLRICFFEIIKPIFISLIYDINGNHIIFKFMNEFQDFLEQITSIIEGNCLNLATHKKGCIFLQNYLLIIKNAQCNKKQIIINNLLKECLILITDKIGNYVIQQLISLGDDIIISEIINKIINNISFYCKHKYSNYVIEKLFIYANPNDKNRILIKFCTPEIISDLLFDQVGNYLIIQALQLADNEKRNIMVNIIYNLESKIKNCPHGASFLNKLYNCNFYSKNENYKSFNTKK